MSSLPQAGRVGAQPVDGELRFQRCEDCGVLRWPPRTVCHACLSARFWWETASRTGTVLSYVIANRPIFEEPSVWVHVAFDDGVRCTGRLSRAAAPEVIVGRRATWSVKALDGQPAVWFDLSDADPDAS